jgi:hypothetical protein
MKTRMMFKSLLLIVMFAIAAPSVSFATETPRSTTETPEQQVARLTNRLEEIRAMDLKNLPKKEKKALRGEVRAIKKEMKALSGGVYISIGAILLIVLLIILLA